MYPADQFLGVSQELLFSVLTHTCHLLVHIPSVFIVQEVFPGTEFSEVSYSKQTDNN